MAIVVKKIKGRKYVYEQYRVDGKVVTRYIGPLEEIVRVYELWRAGQIRGLDRRLVRYYARQIAREIENRLVNSKAPEKTKKERKEEVEERVAGPRGFEPRTTGSAGPRSYPGYGLGLKSFLTNEVVEGFRSWLLGRVSADTAEYYVNVVRGWDGETVPEKRAHRKALRQFLEYLYEQGLLPREHYLELRDRLKIGGYKPSKETQRAIGLDEVLAPLERLPEHLRVVWLMGLYSGARLSHVLEALAGWSPGEEIIVLGAVRRKRLECEGEVCTYWLGSVHGRKKQYELFLPRWLAEKVEPLNLEYSIKDMLYHRYGAKYSVLRKFANQKLAELAIRHGYPEDAWRWILSRDISISGRHYLNLHDIAVKLYQLYAQELDAVIPAALRGSGYGRS